MTRKKSTPRPGAPIIDEETGVASLPPCDAADVHAYWKARFGEYPSDGTLRELPVQSGCGVPCVAAIDAAALLVAHIRSAIGETRDDDNDYIRCVQDMALQVVRVYWHG